MQYIEQLVKEIQETKPLRMCVCYFLTFQKNKLSQSKDLPYKEVDMRFSTDTDEIQTAQRNAYNLSSREKRHDLIELRLR